MQRPRDDSLGDTGRLHIPTSGSDKGTRCRDRIGWSLTTLGQLRLHLSDELADVVHRGDRLGAHVFQLLGGASADLNLDASPVTDRVNGHHVFPPVHQSADTALLIRVEELTDVVGRCGAEQEWVEPSRPLPGCGPSGMPKAKGG